MPRPTRTLPAALERAAGRFDKWRKSRRKGEKIPDELWGLAAKLGGKYGLNKTAARLRLDYYDLKRRIETTVPPVKRSSARAPTFIEVIPETPSVGHKCIVEFERPGGSKMRIHFESADAAELAALGKLFWLGER